MTTVPLNLGRCGQFDICVFQIMSTYVKSEQHMQLLRPINHKMEHPTGAIGPATQYVSQVEIVVTFN